jgi:hypothetical protein
LRVKSGRSIQQNEIDDVLNLLIGDRRTAIDGIAGSPVPQCFFEISVHAHSFLHLARNIERALNISIVLLRFLPSIINYFLGLS